MGLLDALNSDDGMLGMGLLAAAAPQMEPTNGAARIAQAMGAYRGMKADQLKQQLGTAQMQALQQQTALGGLQLNQAQQEWALQQPLLQGLVARMSGGMGGQPAAGAPTASQPAIAPTQGGALGSGTFGMSVGGQSATAPAATTGSAPAGGGSMIPGVPDDVTRWTVATGGLKGIPALMTEYNKPTDFQKLLTAAGIDPRSPQGQAAVLKQINKLNNIPLVAGRAGAPMYNPDGTIAAMAPKIPDNAIPQIVGGQVVGVSPLPGASQVEQINSYASAAGKAQTKPITAYRGNQPVFTNELAAAQGGDPFAGLPQPQAGVNSTFSGKPEDVIASIANIKDPQERANALAAFQAQMRQGGGQLTPAPALGAQTGAEAAQTELSKKWQALQDSNREAQNTSSYLDNIAQLASKAATGPFTNKLQFTNALLGLVGNEKALDATTANNLLDKYAGQIVTRLGTGGLGTDAARSILQSAYPNAHMTPAAIQEAVANLKGAQAMIQAKTRFLQQPGTARDPATYSQREIQFDQNADPRVWQYLSITDPAQRKVFAQHVMQQDPAFPNKLRALEGMGVLSK